jgi:hypothetical protein
MTRATTPVLVAFGLLLGLTLLPAFAVPSTAAGANDAFDSAKKIKGLPYTNSADTADATSDNSDPAATCAPDGLGHTVWYKLKRRKTTDVEVNTKGSDYDTVLAVYTRSDTGELTEVTCDDDTIPTDFGESEVFFTAERRTAYYIVVAAYGEKSAGNLELNVIKQLP